ncbi:MAG: hypothetical protein ABSF83_13775 [Nitrososphaerales archaeon]|jgi:hypothetical protein
MLSHGVIDAQATTQGSSSSLATAGSPSMPVLELIQSRLAPPQPITVSVPVACGSGLSSSGTQCYEPSTYASDLPIANQIFYQYVQVEWAGSENVSAPKQLTALSTTAEAWADAAANCILAGSGQISSAGVLHRAVGVQLRPVALTWLTYQCVAGWSYVPQAGISGDIASLASSTAESSVRGVLGFKGGGAVGAVVGDTTGDLSTAATEVYGIWGEQLLLGTSFTFGFLPYRSGGTQVNVLNQYEPIVFVVAPQAEWDAFIWMLDGTLVAGAVSGGLSVSGLALLATCRVTAGVSCVVGAALIAASLLTGAAASLWYEDQLAISVPDFSQFVPQPSVPSWLSQMQNDSGAQLIYDGYMYAAYMNASIDSNERAYGAIQEGAPYLTGEQVTRASEFASNASVYFAKMQSLAVTLVQSADGAGEINLQAFASGQSILSSDKLPQSVADYLAYMGVSRFLKGASGAGVSFDETGVTRFLAAPPSANPAALLAHDDSQDVSSLTSSQPVTTSTDTTTADSKSPSPSTAYLLPGLVAVVVGAIVVIGFVMYRRGGR